MTAYTYLLVEFLPDPKQPIMIDSVYEEPRLVTGRVELQGAGDAFFSGLPHTNEPKVQALTMLGSAGWQLVCVEHKLHKVELWQFQRQIQKPKKFLILEFVGLKNRTALPDWVLLNLKTVNMDPAHRPQVNVRESREEVMLTLSRLGWELATMTQSDEIQTIVFTMPWD